MTAPPAGMERTQRAAAAAVLLLLGGVAAPGTFRAGRAVDEPAGLVNINTANVEQLQLLPDIGPALAKRIADDRAAQGAFSGVEDLTRVRGIGDLTLRRLREYATTGD